MDVLILGGESPRHYEWVRQVAEALKPHFGRVVYLDYKHWPEKADADIPYEIEAASRTAENLGQYVVVAKSIGTAITALATHEGKLHPERCVFLGFPLHGILRRLAADQKWLADLPPTAFVQNEQDPTGSAADVAAYLGMAPIKEYTFSAEPGDTHNYVDFDLITQLALGQRPTE